MKDKRRVKFHYMRDIWIIPNTDDITNAGLKDQLWWSETEAATIKASAFREVNNISLFNRGYSHKQLCKTIWYELDFDAIYEMLDTFKITNKIELKKLYELYTIKRQNETNSKIF
jgi:hypothetical protein